MHYFSIADADGRHLGFLVMAAGEDESGGQFALSIAEDAPELPAALLKLAQNQDALFWQATPRGVNLNDGDGRLIGSIFEETLTLAGQRYLLQDLTGSL